MNFRFDRLNISGFKSIKQCSFELGNLNVLIGENGSGKSNLMSALALLSDVFRKDLQNVGAISDVSSLFYRGLKVTDEISLELSSEKGSYGFVLGASDEGRLVFKDEYIVKLGGHKLSLGSGHFESQYDLLISEVDWLCDLAMTCQNLRVYHFSDMSRSARLRSEGNLCEGQHLNSDAGNLAAFLYGLKRAHASYYDEIVRTIQLVDSNFGDFVLEPQDLNPELIVLRWKRKDCDEVFDSSALAQGTLRFICLAVLLVQPDILKPNIIMIDEVDIGLSPIALTIVAEMLQSAAHVSQVIVATHSVEMMDKFDVQDAVLVQCNANGTRCQRQNEESLKLWLDEGYTLGALWQSKILENGVQ